MVDFTIPPDLEAARQSVTAFMEQHVYPNEDFARFKVAVVIQPIYFRYVKGQTQDQRFRNLDQLVVGLARESLQLAQGSAI